MPRIYVIVDTDEEGASARLMQPDREGVMFYDTVESMVRSARLDALAIGTRVIFVLPTL